MKRVFASRKFWASIVALLYAFLSVLAPDFPITEEVTTGVVTVLAAYILGVALEDGLRAAPSGRPGGKSVVKAGKRQPVDNGVDKPADRGG